jgi:hypothetical protein
MNDEIAGGFVIGDGLQQGYVSLKMAHPSVAPSPPTLNGSDIDIIRALVTTAVDKALYPGGTIDGHEHRRVEMSDQDGKRWRGVLYRVDSNATDPMLPVAKEE